MVPELAESISEGTIAEWLKKPGDRVEQGEPVAVLETDKVNIEVSADSSGVIHELLKQEGDTVYVGETIATIDPSGEAAVSENTATAEPKAQEAQSEPAEQAVQQAQVQKTNEIKEEYKPGQRSVNDPIASPAARKQAREKGIDLNEVQSRDPLGRIRVEDVKAQTEQKVELPRQQVPSIQPVVSNQEDGRPVERVRMSRRRQTIAQRLVEVQQTAAMLTTFNEVDMSAVIELRNRWKDRFFEQHNVRLGFMSFFTKAVVGALRQFPLLNAEIQGDEMLIKKYYDIGVAVSTDEGLVVPVVRDADKLTFAEIEQTIAELAEKARNNKLSLSDLQGGTFTITNGGVFGSLMSTPILNGNQVGILGMHSIQKRPVAVGDTIEIRPMMYIALSYDHRIVDGKEAVSFLVKVKEMIEDPETLLLEG